MWNQFRTDAYEGMLAETISICGYNGDQINAYLSRPLGEGPYPSVVIIPAMGGWDEFCKETARRFSQHGYIALCPDIYSRFGKGAPRDVAKIMQESGIVPDDSVIGDCEGSLSYLLNMPGSNQKAGVIGMCSGGRHAYLAACRINGFSAAVDCWGDRVIIPEGGLTPSQPVAPIDYTEGLNCPLLGLFGNDDKAPTPDLVNQQEEILKKHGKDYVFHRYDGAGHAFMSYGGRSYRPQQAMDAWDKIFEFFGKHLIT